MLGNKMIIRITLPVFTLLAVIQFSVCLTWTKYPASITRVWNGSTVALQWDYNLTDREQTAAQTAINLIWKRANESHLVNVGKKTFLLFSSPPNSIEEELKPHITISRSEKATLIINDVTKEDEGVYQILLILLTLSFTATQNTTLEVRVQPTLQCPKTVQVIEGEKGIMSCNATGDPEPNRTWTKETQPGKVLSRNSTLVINNVSIFDEGMYNTTANNGRTASALVELMIIFAPRMTNLTSNPLNTTVQQDNNLTLLCITNANPPATYYFYFNQSFIGKSNSGEFNVTVEGDGMYTCVPINNVGAGNNATLNVTTVVPSSVRYISNGTATAVEGDRLNFSCTASGKPEPKIAWTKVGSARVITYTPSVSVIVDRPVTPDNINQYRCTARNGVGTPATATVNVTVYYKPSATTSSKTIDVEVGGNKSIPCLEVIGNPPAAISWYRGNSTSGDNITNNLDLTVKNAAESDAGWYTCFAKNDIGDTTFKVLVRVVPRKTPSTTPAPCPKTPSEKEFHGKAVVKANCSERLQVATELPNVFCDLLSVYDCEDGRSCNSSCGSVVVYFILKFKQAISGDQVVNFLKKQAQLNNFGRLKVDYKSIIQIPSPTTSTASPTTLTELPSEESCPDSMFKDKTCELKWQHIGPMIGVGVALVAGICLFAWCKCGPTEGAPCCICRRRNCDKCPNRSVSPTQPFSSNHSIHSEGSPQADENSGYHKLGPLPAVDVVVVGQEVEKSKENGKKKDSKAAEQKPTEGPMTIGEIENQTTKVDFIGEEAIPTYAAVDKSKKKNKKKEHKPTEDQYAVVDKSKKKKKKNEPDATYAEVDMSKKSIKKQKPGEVLYADLGEFHQMQRMPEVSTSPKTLPPVKRPEAYAETQYADITQFLRGSPGDTGAEPPKDSTTLAVSNSATGSKEESSAGNAGDVEEATNETGF